MKHLASSVAVLALTAAPALANIQAVTATDLNLRAGPGSSFDAKTVMPAGSEVMVNGCIESTEWCDVSFNDMQGWAYAHYLAVDVDGNYAAIASRPETITVNTVTYTTPQDAKELVAGTTAGAAMGAIAAVALGGPVGGIIAGGMLGAAAGSAVAEPDEKVVTYVTANPVENVRLKGEAVVGARVPLDQVTVYEVPENDGFKYLYLNGAPAIVTADEGQIVYLGK